MVKIAIIVGSTRPGRKAMEVANWVFAAASQRTDAEFEIVDIADYDLPVFDEPLPPSFGRYSKPHTQRWAAKIASFDGFVFVTPEYNHSFPGALKNAIDFLFAEWSHKAAGFVSYGSAGGVRAVEQLRVVMAEVHVATVRTQVALSLANDFENYTTFKPGPRHATTLTTMFDQVVSWATALQTVPQRRPRP